MDQLGRTIAFLLNDYRQTVLPDVRSGLIQRELSLGAPLKPHVGNLVKVIVGMRRCGKTFRLFQEMIGLLDAGIPERNICYFNFDDDRIKPYQPDVISRVLETFFELNPEARATGSYLFFDEIQNVPGWDQVMRRIVDTEKVTAYLTGSSSRLLSEDIATEFRGRSLAFELAPLSFAEYVRMHGIAERDLDESPNKEVTSHLRSLFSHYLLTGGFPAVQNLSDPERIQTLQAYVQLTVSRDIVERHGYPNSAFVRNLARSVVASSARDFSISRADHQGRSAGYSPGREAIGTMVDDFEDAHLAYGLYEFTRSAQRNRLGGFKVYASDTGLLHAMAPATTDSQTRALETSVYLELRRRRATSRMGGISMLKLPSKREVDFVWGDEAFGEAYSLTQVCLDMDDPKTRSRELAALDEAMAHFPGARAEVVTLSEEGEERLESGPVHIVPAWRWMLAR